MLRVSISEVKEGVKTARPVYGSRGELLVNHGVPLRSSLLNSLAGRGFSAVDVDEPDTEDIDIREVITPSVHSRATQTIARIFQAVEAAVSGIPSKDIGGISDAIRDPGVTRQLAKAPIFQELPSIAGEVVDEALEVDILDSLGQLKSHDDYTFGHSVDVAVCAVMIARRLGFPKERLVVLAQGAMLHDIGKVFVDLSVLNKPCDLAAEEIAAIQLHPVLGFELLRHVDVDLLAKHVALQHHERQDGSGYPRGLRGTNRVFRSPRERHEGIALLGEIAAVADVFDALSSDRPYRKGLPPDIVAAELRAMAGRHLNAEIVHHFLAMLPAYPVGMTVEVTSGPYAGYRGVVCRIDLMHLNEPTVRLLYDADGHRIGPVEIDLGRDGCSIRSQAIAA